MNNKHTEFLQNLIKKGEGHRETARRFSRDNDNELNDTKYHDGMADQAIALSIRFQEVFGEEVGLIKKASLPEGD